MNKFYRFIAIILLLTNFATIGLMGYIFYTYDLRATSAEANYQQLRQDFNAMLLSQRTQKDEIADIYDDQAALNDDLIDQQKQTVAKSTEFLAYLERSIRFVDGQAQFTETVSEEEYLGLRNLLNTSIFDLNRLSEENASLKEKNSSRVSQIYLEASEDRNNSANDREGFR
jgi:enoyl-[acyl-carrier-protein] reductase (NADH)